MFNDKMPTPSIFPPKRFLLSVWCDALHRRAQIVARYERLRAQMQESTRRAELLFQGLLALSFIEGLWESFTEGLWESFN